MNKPLVILASLLVLLTVLMFVQKEVSSMSMIQNNFGDFREEQNLETRNPRTHLLTKLTREIDFDTITDYDFNQSNRTKHLNGIGVVKGNGTGEAFLLGVGFINLSGFTGIFSYDGPITNYSTDNCNDLGDMWECENGNVNLNTVDDTLDAFFNGKADNFKIQGNGEGWFKGFGLIEWEACITPKSGMILAEDTKFCKGRYWVYPGITLVKDNITLDCNGATLIGSWGRNSVGITINSTGAVITKCYVTEFWAGIQVGNYSTLRDNSINWQGSILDNSSGDGIIARNVSYITITTNRIKDNYGNAILIQNSSHITILNNNISRNLGYGIELTHVDGWEISGNLLDENGLWRNIDSGAFALKGSGNGLMTLNSIEEVPKELPTFTILNSNASIYKNNIFQSFPYSTFIKIKDSSILWNDTNYGNYWSKYDSELEGCFDVDLNLICDSPFFLDPFNVDYYPFVKQDGWV